MKGQSGTSIVVKDDQNAKDSSVAEQRSQLGLGALGRGSRSYRKNQSADTDGTLQKSALCDSDLLKGSSIISASKLLQAPIAVMINLNNGTSSGQGGTSSGQCSTSVGKLSGINTALAMASNIGH
eukprot:14062213-Ditylum_brightwellii.AAC.1